MCSRFLDRVALALATAALVVGAQASARNLVVCADPADLPYSSEERSGFENRVVQLVADEMSARLVYRWQPLRRGVARKTLGAHVCDVLAGVPVGMPGVATTSPYYRSAFVFVARRDGRPPIASFDDPRLRKAAIGVQLVGADGAATPAAFALARRGIVGNVVGFPVYGAEPAAQRIVEAIDGGRIDVAVAWGPQIGYFAQRAHAPLVVSVARDDEALPLAFDIALGVRKDDVALRDALDEALARVRAPIRAVLADFAVPVVDPAPAVAERAR